jgi:hypothetical protein
VATKIFEQIDDVEIRLTKERGGIFDVRLDEKLVFSKTEQGLNKEDIDATKIVTLIEEGTGGEPCVS